MRNHNTLSDVLFGETIVDTLFGTLELNRGSSQRYWFTDVVFAPTQTKITLFFSKLEGAVPNRVKEFYVEIENRYEALKAPIGDCLYSAYNKEVAAMERDGVWQAVRLAAISLPSADEIERGEANWTLDYAYDFRVPNKVFDVAMVNWEVVECNSGEGGQN